MSTELTNYKVQINDEKSFFRFITFRLKLNEQGKYYIVR